MPKKPPKPTITLDIDTWTLATVLSRLGPQALLDENDPPERTAWRRQRERDAQNGNVTALADLIKFSPYYLAWPWTVATIFALRSGRSQARTRGTREEFNDAFDCLDQAVRGRNLQRTRPHAPPGDAANLYGLLLPMYRAAAEGKRLKDVVKYRTVKEVREAVKKQEAPVSAVLLMLAANQDTDSIELPPSLNCYWKGKEREGIARNQPPPRTGKVVIRSEFTFTVPAVDLELLSQGEVPSTVALARVKALLGIGKDGEDLDWITRLVRKGKRDSVR